MPVLPLGLIGAGRWGSRYLSAVGGMTSARITMVCTSRTPPPSCPDDVQVVRSASELIASSACDAVVVCTPPATHAALVREAIARGKSVMVEKPLCLDPGEARSLDRDVRQSGVPVLVNHIHLFNAAYEPLRAAAKRHGGVRGIVCEGAGFGPFRLDTPALWDWGPHDVALALDLIGSMPVRVDAVGRGFAGGPGTHAEAVALSLEFGRDVSGWIVTGRMSLERRRSTTVFCDSAAFAMVEAAGTTTLTEFDVGLAARYEADTRPAPIGGTLRFSSTDRPLSLALEHFVHGVQYGATRYFGTSLAADVVDVLSRADRALARRTGALLP